MLCVPWLFRPERSGGAPGADTNERSAIPVVRSESGTHAALYNESCDGRADGGHLRVHSDAEAFSRGQGHPAAERFGQGPPVVSEVDFNRRVDFKQNPYHCRPSGKVKCCRLNKCASVQGWRVPCQWESC